MTWNSEGGQAFALGRKYQYTVVKTADERGIGRSCNRGLPMRWFQFNAFNRRAAFEISCTKVCICSATVVVSRIAKTLCPAAS